MNLVRKWRWILRGIMEVAALHNCKSTSYTYCCEFGALSLLPGGDCVWTVLTDVNNASTPCTCSEPPVDISTRMCWSQQRCLQSCLVFSVAHGVIVPASSPQNNVHLLPNELSMDSGEIAPSALGAELILLAQEQADCRCVRVGASFKRYVPASRAELPSLDCATSHPRTSILWRCQGRRIVSVSGCSSEFLNSSCTHCLHISSGAAVMKVLRLTPPIPLFFVTFS